MGRASAICTLLLHSLLMHCNAEVIGYWDWSWSPMKAPPGANLGIAFSGWADWSKVLYSEALDQSAHLNDLSGDKWISIGGGNTQGMFSASNLGSLTAAINSGRFSGYHGIVFDIEECEESGLESAFGQAMGAARGKGIQVMVTVSNAAPYKCGDAANLMRSFFTSPNINIISPQLYIKGTETQPDFSTGNKGINWWEYSHAKAAIVPSIVSASQYGHVQWQFGQWGIHTAGYIQWRGEPLPTPAPGPAPPPPHPDVHGTYTVKAGDTCWDISQSVCGDGQDWQKMICDGGKKCTEEVLSIGEKLQYDCSGTGEHCGGYILI